MLGQNEKPIWHKFLHHDEQKKRPESLDGADASSSPQRERSATPFTEEWRRQLNGGEASGSQQRSRSPSRSRSPASPPQSRSPTPFTPEAIQKEKALEARGQAQCRGAAPQGQRELPVVPRDPSQQRSERGQQGGGRREDFSRRNNNDDNNRRQNNFQAEQSGGRRQEFRNGGGSGQRDQDSHNRTPQPGPNLDSEDVVSQPGTVAVPQLPSPATSTHEAVAPGTVAIPEFHPNQMSYPPPPLGTVAIQQINCFLTYFKK
ncbi:hypothetical protein CAEBREN_18322 [Caenorhabditis brenneri]|uniref:Uncharacterized protein n=1 Tax=Caenorhabditis brenneri TaxID=135651 RepID=G0NX36_CAEBE|nr:hypothetical protein CAEBREN_18322 [Caenorhabditis brenneri]